MTLRAHQLMPHPVQLPAYPQAAQQGIGEAHQFLEAHGLDQIVIGAAIEPRQLVRGGGAVGEQDDPPRGCSRCNRTAA